MRNNWEVITTSDKAKRDEMYHDLRENGNSLERQVVKFSDCELTDEVELVFYEHGDDAYPRPVYRSTWSIAYPRSDV